AEPAKAKIDRMGGERDQNEREQRINAWPAFTRSERPDRPRQMVSRRAQPGDQQFPVGEQELHRGGKHDEEQNTDGEQQNPITPIRMPTAKNRITDVPCLAIRNERASACHRPPCLIRCNCVRNSPHLAHRETAWSARMLPPTGRNAMMPDACPEFHWAEELRIITRHICRTSGRALAAVIRMESRRKHSYPRLFLLVRSRGDRQEVVPDIGALVVLF